MDQKAKKPPESESESHEKSQHDRGPYQKNQDRDAVKSAEETKDIPTKHGAIK
jgi:hypothetical protein